MLQFQVLQGATWKSCLPPRQYCTQWVQAGEERETEKGRHIFCMCHPAQGIFLSLEPSQFLLWTWIMSMHKWRSWLQNIHSRRCPTWASLNKNYQWFSHWCILVVPETHNKLLIFSTCKLSSTKHKTTFNNTTNQKLSIRSSGSKLSEDLFDVPEPLFLKLALLLVSPALKVVTRKYGTNWNQRK